MREGSRTAPEMTKKSEVGCAWGRNETDRGGVLVAREDSLVSPLSLIEGFALGRLDYGAPIESL